MTGSGGLHKGRRNMIRHRWILGIAAVAAIVGVSSLSAQEPKTITEKIKAKAGSAVESIKKGAASAEGAISNQFHKAKGAVTNMEIEARVYARIHWDKTLAGSKIELGAPKVGVISLTGTVGSDKAKAKAIELAGDTVGVTEVVDNLKVEAAAPTATKP